MLPQRFEERMRPLLGVRYAELEAWAEQPLTTRGLRVNTLKCTAESLQRCLTMPLTPTAFSENGFVTAADFRAGSDPLHHAGAYYMQEPSAMSAVTLLAPRPGERVLDLCAAPGGKSTQIAAALQGQGLLWANEYVPNRARVLAQNIERCGVRNAVVSCGDTARLAAALPQWFDAVLADVPCSGEGMFRKEPEALTGWSEENIALCAERSRTILNNAAQCVRPGGRLVISTCTFACEENECAVVRFLHDHPDFTLEPVTLPFGEPGFEAEAIDVFDDGTLSAFARTVPLSRCRRIFPWNGGEGHFLALLRREGESVCTAEPSASRSNNADATVVAAGDLYASCFADEPPGRLVRTGDVIRLLPWALPETEGVHVLNAGVPVAQVMTGRTWRLEPTHALFQSARAADCRQLVDFSRDDPRILAFLRGEELTVEAEDGWCGVAVEGVVTGFGKAVGGRLKNRYPKGLRLLHG